MSLYLRIKRADFEHVTQLRWLIEGAALDKCASLRDPKQLAELAEAIARQRLGCETGNHQDYQAWHHQFHQKIVGTLENPVITMIYAQVLALVREPMEMSGSDPEVRSRSISSHEQILEALRRGSATDARQILDEHLRYFIVDMQNI